MISFDDVKDAAKLQIRTLAQQLVPGGSFSGNWYNVRVPWRDDSRASLAISLTTTHYRDWGTPGDNGTIIDLVMKLDSCDARKALTTLAAMLGLDSTAPSVPRPKRHKPACVDCRNVWNRYEQERYCAALVDMNGEPQRTRLVRRQGQACGPFAALFLART